MWLKLLEINSSKAQEIVIVTAIIMEFMRNKNLRHNADAVCPRGIICVGTGCRYAEDHDEGRQHHMHHHVARGAEAQNEDALG